MINTWNKLIEVIKAFNEWWNTPLVLKRSQDFQDQPGSTQTVSNTVNTVLRSRRLSDDVLGAYYKHQSYLDIWSDQLTKEEKKEYSNTWGDPFKREEFIRKLKKKYGFK